MVFWKSCPIHPLFRPSKAVAFTEEKPKCLGRSQEQDVSPATVPLCLRLLPLIHPTLATLSSVLLTQPRPAPTLWPLQELFSWLDTALSYRTSTRFPPSPLSDLCLHTPFSMRSVFITQFKIITSLQLFWSITVLFSFYSSYLKFTYLLGLLSLSPS